MSKVLRGNISCLERIQFRDLESVPDSSEENVFEVAADLPLKDTVNMQQKAQQKTEKNAGEKPAKLKAQDQSPKNDIDIDSIKAEAYDQGRSDGRKEIMNELDSTLRAFSKAGKELDGIRTNLFNRQGEDMVRLAMVVAEQIIKTELSLNAELVLNIVHSALKSALEADQYHIRVNPADLETVQENKPLFMANMNGLQQITLEGDASITRGGCIVEYDKGQVDSRLEIKLSEIRYQLQQAVST